MSCKAQESERAMADDDIRDDDELTENTSCDDEVADVPEIDPTLFQYVDTVIAPKLAHAFGEEAQDVEQDFWLKVVKSKIQLKDIEHPKAYCYIAVKHQSLNRQRHYQNEKDHTDSHNLETLVSMADVVCESSALNPEEALLLKERKAQVRDRILQIVYAVEPKEAAEVVHLRLMGVHPTEIARLLGKARATIYRMGKPLKEVQKKIIADLGVEEILKTQPRLRPALDDLIARSLMEEYKIESAPLPPYSRFIADRIASLTSSAR
jgi:DNA-directed RNA polymerase specialized sigma24 family protein